MRFRGEYPIAQVDYRDEAVPAAVALEAFSPFVPLQTDDSSLPATILCFSVKNLTAAPLDVTLAGELENAICRGSPWAAARRRNRLLAGDGFTFAECSAEAAPSTYVPLSPETEFENWSGQVFPNWTSGSTQISAEFKVEKPYVNFGRGQGPLAEDTVIRLIVDGRVVRTTKANALAPAQVASMEVEAFIGRSARLEIAAPGSCLLPVPGVGRISFADWPSGPGPVAELPGFGTMGLALLRAAGRARRRRGNGRIVGRIGHPGRPLHHPGTG